MLHEVPFTVIADLGNSYVMSGLIVKADAYTWSDESHLKNIHFFPVTTLIRLSTIGHLLQLQEFL